MDSMLVSDNGNVPLTRIRIIDDNVFLIKTPEVTPTSWEFFAIWNSPNYDFHVYTNENLEIGFEIVPTPKDRVKNV